MQFINWNLKDLAGWMFTERSQQGMKVNATRLLLSEKINLQSKKSFQRCESEKNSPHLPEEKTRLDFSE